MKANKNKFGILAGLILSSCVFGQTTNANLVMNGSFENTSNKKVHGWGEFFKADSLSSANNTTVDLYSKNSCGKDFSIPANYMGNQDAKDGNNYIGIIAYYAPDAGIFKTKPGYRKYSEYAQMPLTEPLVAGKAYNISFSLSLAEKSAYAVSGLGVYVSSEKVDVKNNAFMKVTPHIVTREIITNTGWSTFSGTYVASGGEKYLTIGCFDNYMETLKVVPENENNNRKAYYYIDDVSLVAATIAPEDLTSILIGSCFTMQNLNFETDKAVIMDGSFDELKSVAAFLKKYPFLVVYIDGHTDKTGTDAHNDKLSEDRATSVKQYLVDQGVEANRLVARGYGETQPIDLSKDNSVVNRRVEITICAAPKEKGEALK